MINMWAINNMMRKARQEKLTAEAHPEIYPDRCMKLYFKILTSVDHSKYVTLLRRYNLNRKWLAPEYAAREARIEFDW